MTSLLSAVDTIRSLCRQYPEVSSQLALSQQDQATLGTYFAFALEGCYVEASKLYERVLPIQQAGPLLDLAKKIHEQAAPIVQLYQEGQKRLELVKENPSEGPRPYNYYALYLNQLNEAAFSGDLQALITAAQEISSLQKKIAREVSEKKRTIGEASEQLQELCNRRIDELDQRYSLREEMGAWYNQGVWRTVTEYVPDIKTYVPKEYKSEKACAQWIRSQLVDEVAGPVLYIGSMYLAESLVGWTLGKGLLTGILQTGKLAIPAVNLCHALRARSLFSTCMSSIYLSLAIYTLNQATPQSIS